MTGASARGRPVCGAESGQSDRAEPASNKAFRIPRFARHLPCLYWAALGIAPLLSSNFLATSIEKKIACADKSYLSFVVIMKARQPAGPSRGGVARC